MDNRLSKNFTLEEFIFSQTATRLGISNQPIQYHYDNMVTLCEGLLQPLRERLNRPMRVSSGYRSKALNKEVKGSLRSQHCKGEAVDFSVTGWTSTEVCQYILDQGFDFDQLIDEGNWVHVSYKAEGNKKEVLTANFYKEDGKTKVNYTNGLKE